MQKAIMRNPHKQLSSPYEERISAFHFLLPVAKCHYTVIKMHHRCENVLLQFRYGLLYGHMNKNIKDIGKASIVPY
ncbi:hypothetical protein PVAP13_8KG296601 [Panicum virgatum]|uniref:Uncharacterized protein n=1 Tax=Panicum virgatum TaxID=38727 RepID=A0A8T0PWN8_PANVG|nr:hypothetical protein PVAP13_8KG296601 [Panicum virgatum]